MVGEPWTGLYTDVGGAMFEPSGRIRSHRVTLERVWRTKAYGRKDRSRSGTGELLQSAVLHWREISVKRYEASAISLNPPVN